MNWMARAALIAMIAGGLTHGVAHADPAGDHCSTRSGCYTGPGSRWCPGDYVWPGLVATGWDLTTCHVYHEQCPPGYVGGCPDDIVDGPAPPVPPAIISTREQCEAILGIFCPKA
jgi:hypothetical protein